MGRFDLPDRARSVRARLAAVALAALGVAVGAGSGWQQTLGVDDDAAEEDSLGQVQLSVSSDFSTLQLTGPIVFGVTRRVRDMLEAYPSITTVRLTSPGGRVVEARAMSELITRRGLTTLAAGNCASACTVLFMAGRERLVESATTVGFHRYHSPDPEQADAEANMAIDRRYFRARGLPDWFIERAFTTPNDGMWRPSFDEMRTAHVVTGQVAADGRRIALQGAPTLGAQSEPGERSERGQAVNASEAPR